MSEGVEILISADDQASQVLGKVADNVDAKVKRIREVGGRAKASTEFIGNLSQTLGGSELGSYASSLASLTEKISAFSEVSKAGGTGALAFRAGIAAVVAVASYKVGEAIGNAVFQTKKWKEELEAAEKAAKQLDAAVLKAASRTFNIQKQELDLLDGDAQVAQVQEWMARLENEIIGKKRQIQDKLKAEEDLATAWLGSPEDRAKIRDTTTEEAELQQLRDQLEELRFGNSERAKSIELQKQENALKERNRSQIEGLKNEVDLLRASKEERAAIEAMQKSGGDAESAVKIESLLREKEASEAKKESAKEAEKLIELKAKELAKLEEQRIALEHGKEAAHAFALAQQGLDKSTADRIANEQSAIDKQKAEQSFKQPELNAVQSRLLTRGPVEKGIDKVAKNTEQAATELKYIRGALENQKANPTPMEFVS